jgi:hypothetical protein
MELSPFLLAGVYFSRALVAHGDLTLENVQDETTAGPWGPLENLRQYGLDLRFNLKQN